MLRLLTWCLVWVLSAAPALAEEHHDGAHHRRPDNIQEYLEHLDRAERDEYQQPTRVIEALDLRPGMAVADLGSGSGYFTRRFVEAVGPSGTVYAVDVEPEMLAYVKRGIEAMGASTRIDYIQAAADNAKLPEKSVDLIFLCNVYHHLEDRPAYFSSLRSALKSGGRLVVIDFYDDARSGNVGFPRRHLVAQRTVLEELSQAGYHFIREHTFLPR